MIDRTYELSVETIGAVNVVSLKVARRAGTDAQRRLALAEPLRATAGDPRSCWIGPDHWLLMSRQTSAPDMIAHCERGLSGILHNAVDYSAGLAGFRLAGGGVRDILAGGTAVDLRPVKFPVGSFTRTRFAQIPAHIIAVETDSYEIWVDRGDAHWLEVWLADTEDIVKRAGLATAGTDCTWHKGR